MSQNQNDPVSQYRNDQLEAEPQYPLTVALPGPRSSGPLAVAPSQVADRHPALVYLARLAPGSRRTMGEALTVMAMRLSADTRDLWTLAWHELRYQHTAALRSLLAERYAPATVNKMLAALRGTLKECWRLGLVSAEDYHRAADLPAVRGSVLPRGRALSAGELRALLAACAGDRTPGGAQDGALVATLYDVGLRRSEVIALAVSTGLFPEEETGFLDKMLADYFDGKMEEGHVCLIDEEDRPLGVAYYAPEMVTDGTWNLW